MNGSNQVRLSALIEGIDKEVLGMEVIGNDDVEVSSISLDSREVQPGALFAALPGLESDGFDYIDDALAKGAASILAERASEGLGVAQIIASDPRAVLAHISERFYGSPAEQMSLVGVTGTNGKTTTAFLVESILKEAALKCGVIGTVNYRYNGKVLNAKRTTPESTELSALMAEMVAANVTHAVIEVSSHALAQKRADACRFIAAIFTNLTHEHLDYHETMEDYFEAKARLFSELMKKGGVAVINVDDSFGVSLADTLDGALTYSLKEGAGIFPNKYSITAAGISAALNTPEGTLNIESSLIGAYNLSNIMAAVGAALSLGIESAVISKGISALKRIPGRLDRVGVEESRAGAPRFYVDYAHTADALERVLETLKSITEGRLITVFGCGGDRDTEKRPLMGEAAARLSDITIITSDNPRGEDPVKIIEDIEAGIKGVKKFDVALEFSGHGYAVITERREAIEKAVESAGDHDTVLIAGKGHEDYQLIGEKRLKFDDFDELSRAISARAASANARD
ncbi:MAG: UDP-N-acetylmuramoyl-L-alanyl-D-glutamate--2,6-diaminopimelate ligase [Thermodesulfobacteriota bacterium]